MYTSIFWFLFSYWRNRIWATTTSASGSSICCPMKTIRSLRSRE